jgi:hypothetical protein
MIRFRVDPPTVREVPYGLLDVAEVIEREDAHWRTGIEYDTVACNQAKLWGRWCTASGMPATLPDAVDITITLTGALTTGTYSLTAAATVESPNAARQITFVYYEQASPQSVHTTTGAAAVTVASSDEPLNGHLVITDVLTGASIDYNLAQNADTGALEHPASPIVFAVPQAAVPDGCTAIRTSITAAAADPGEGVSFAITTGGDTTGERVITIAGHQITLAAGDADGTLVIETGVGEGTWPISVRDESGSFVSGWIYIDADLSGFASLVQATCPVKEIRSAPWTTQFAPAWTIYSEVECQSMAFEDASAAAREHLALSGHKAIEAAWWDLAWKRSRSLGSGLSLTAAIAELEHYIAVNYSGVGIIHMPVYLAAWASHDYLVYRDGGLETLRGTPVVLGSGYPRQGDASGAGTAVMATGAVRLYSSAVEVVETFDRRTNLKSAVAERTLAAADDCLEPAVVFVDTAVER